MLKQRVITAVILLLIVLAALYAENPLYWLALVNTAVAIGFWEWLRFCKIENLSLQAVCFVVFVVVSVLVQTAIFPIALVTSLACIMWLVLFVFTLTDKLEVLHQTAIKVAVGVLVLCASALIVIEIKQINNGPLWILCFFFCVWAADVGAYFTGKRFGKTKLAPNISPGKTVEGLLGGLALAALIFVPIMFWNFSFSKAILILLTIAVTVLVSVMGDLFESKMKRYAGLKDSSQILPGHGGVLDRIDSLLSGAPFFAAGLMLLGFLR